MNEVFAHEIAHQYWGTVVKMPSIEEQWLTESFADYCAALFMKAYKNEAEYKSIVKHWRGRRRSRRPSIPIPLANNVYVSSDVTTPGHIRDGLLYNKGPGAPLRPPQRARRRSVLHFSEVVPEVVRLEVRLHEESSRACSNT